LSGVTSEAPRRPSWLTPYLPAFGELARVVSLSGSFVLVPVQISGPDVAHALARFLTDRGHSVSLVEPRTDEEWRELVATLFGVPSARGDAAVLVVGDAKITSASSHALRLVNQRRDTLASHLGCALLWCGPPEFLDATWERAPDFWSIRTRTHRLEVPIALARETPFWPWAWVPDPPEKLRARLSSAIHANDARGAVRAGISLAEALAERGKDDEALDVVAELTGLGEQPKDLEARLALLRAIAHGHAERFFEAEEAVAKARAFDLDGEERARADVIVGNLLARRDPEAAVAAYGQAAAGFSAVGDARGEAMAYANFGVVLVRSGNSAGKEILEEARTTFQAVGDARSEARVLVKLGAIYGALRDARTGTERLEDALTILRDLRDRRLESAALRRLSRLTLDLGDAEKAADDADAARKLARAAADVRAEAEAVLLLGAARFALGDTSTAREAFEEARRLAEQGADREIEAEARSLILRASP
jgi:tetratricopeptide (TPR) repeat protein